MLCFCVICWSLFKSKQQCLPKFRRLKFPSGISGDGSGLFLLQWLLEKAGFEKEGGKDSALQHLWVSLFEWVSTL